MLNNSTNIYSVLASVKMKETQQNKSFPISINKTSYMTQHFVLLSNVEFMFS